MGWELLENPVGARVGAQRLRGSEALAEDWIQFPATTLVSSQLPVTPASGGSNPFGLHRLGHQGCVLSCWTDSRVWVELLYRPGRDSISMFTLQKQEGCPPLSGRHTFSVFDVFSAEKEHVLRGTWVFLFLYVAHSPSSLQWLVPVRKYVPVGATSAEWLC